MSTLETPESPSLNPLWRARLSRGLWVLLLVAWAGYTGLLGYVAYRGQVVTDIYDRLDYWGISQKLSGTYALWFVVGCAVASAVYYWLSGCRMHTGRGILAVLWATSVTIALLPLTMVGYWWCVLLYVSGATLSMATGLRIAGSRFTMKRFVGLFLASAVTCTILFNVGVAGIDHFTDTRDKRFGLEYLTQNIEAGRAYTEFGIPAYTLSGTGAVGVPLLSVNTPAASGPLYAHAWFREEERGITVDSFASEDVPMCQPRTRKKALSTECVTLSPHKTLEIVTSRQSDFYHLSVQYELKRVTVVIGFVAMEGEDRRDIIRVARDLSKRVVPADFGAYSAQERYHAMTTNNVYMLEHAPEINPFFGD